MRIRRDLETEDSADSSSSEASRFFVFTVRIIIFEEKVETQENENCNQWRTIRMFELAVQIVSDHHYEGNLIVVR